MTKGKKSAGYLPLNLEFLESPAMYRVPVNCWKLLHFLMKEHLKSGWCNKGLLKAPYKQLEEFGIPKRYINLAICEAEDRGVISVKRGARVGRKNYDNEYFLNFIKTKGRRADNAWKKFTMKDYEALKLKQRLQNAKKLASFSEQS